MHTDNSTTRTKLRAGLLLAATACALAVAACGSSSSGSSSGNPQSLLAQTFSSRHNVKSGVLGFSLSVNPSGSSTLTTPLVLSLQGPFQSRGTGQLPASDFNVGISALGHTGSLGIISTGTHGYVSMQGTAYQLPNSDFQRLESSFSSVGSSGRSSGLAGLGIDPQRWLTDPKVVGTETMGGAQTTHIRSGVNVSALLADLNTFLAKTAKSTSGSSSIPTSIPASTRQQIASAVRNARVDIWTGSQDKTLRKLSLALTIPVSGQTSTALGGMSSAGVGLSLRYSDLNQPQTISAPSKVRPYGEFQSRLRSALAGLGGLGGSAGTTSGADKYSQCMQQAGQDAAKMQKCTPLLNK